MHCCHAGLDVAQPNKDHGGVLVLPDVLSGELHDAWSIRLDKMVFLARASGTIREYTNKTIPKQSNARGGWLPDHTAQPQPTTGNHPGIVFCAKTDPKMVVPD